MKEFPFGRKAVLVSRVSTDVQSYNPQIHELEKWAKDEGYTEIKSFETKESGFLEYDLKSGWNLVTDWFDSHPDYRVLICTEISRLGRRKVVLDLIQEYLIEHKIQLIIKDINFHLLNDNGSVDLGKDVIFSLAASLAQSEMRQKKERFRRARQDYGKYGYGIGGKQLFGYIRKYEKIDNRRRSYYEINEKEAEEIKTIYRWYAYGIDGDLLNTSTRTIYLKCIALNMSRYLHSKRNVTKCLQEQAYLGQKTTQNRAKNPEYWNYKNHKVPKYINSNSYTYKYPAIFQTEEEIALFQLVQKRMKQNSTLKVESEFGYIDKSSKHTTLLAKLILCPCCGKPLQGEYRMRGAKRDFNYRCGNCRGAVPKCQFGHTENMPLLDSVVSSVSAGAIYSLRMDELSVDKREKTAEFDKQISNLTEKQKEFDGQTTSLVKQLLSNTRKYPSLASTFQKEFDDNIRNIESHKKEIERNISTIQQERAHFLEKVLALENLATKYTSLETKQDYYRYLHAVIDSIEIVYATKNRTIIHINYAQEVRDAAGKTIKNEVPDYAKNDGYICIFKSTHAGSTKAVLLTYEDPHTNDVEPPIWNIRNCITWDNERQSFITPDGERTLDQIYENAYPTPMPIVKCNSGPKKRAELTEWKERMLHPLTNYYVKIIPLSFKMLELYDEDVRQY